MNESRNFCCRSCCCCCRLNLTLNEITIRCCCRCWDDKFVTTERKEKESKSATTPNWVEVGRLLWKVAYSTKWGLYCVSLWRERETLLPYIWEEEEWAPIFWAVTHSSLLLSFFGGHDPHNDIRVAANSAPQKGWTLISLMVMISYHVVVHFTLFEKEKQKESFKICSSLGSGVFSLSWYCHTVSNKKLFTSFFILNQCFHTHFPLFPLSLPPTCHRQGKLIVINRLAGEYVLECVGLPVPVLFFHFFSAGD